MEECSLLTEARGLVEEEEMRKWGTRQKEKERGRGDREREGERGGGETS